MKTLFVKVLAVTVGVVVGLSMVGIGLYWFTHRPQPRKPASWDSSSITAKLIKYALFERNDKPKEPHFYTQLYFNVTNNTSSDYTLPVRAWKDRLRESHAGSLVSLANPRVLRILRASSISDCEAVREYTSIATVKA